MVFVFDRKKNESFFKRGLCLLLCMMLFPLSACETKRSSDGTEALVAENFTLQTYPAEKAYFKSIELSSLFFSEDQTVSAIAMTVYEDSLAVLMRSTARDSMKSQTHMCFFDYAGVETGSFCLEKIFKTDNISVLYIAGSQLGITAYITIFDNESNKLTSGFYFFDKSGDQFRDPTVLVFSDNSFSPTGIVVLQNGKTALAGVCSEGNVFYVYDTEMNFLYRISGNQLTGKILESGGSVYVESRIFSSGNQKDILYIVDMDTGTLTSSVDVSQIIGGGSTLSNFGKLYVEDDTCLYRIELEEKKKIEVVNWSNLDIDRSTYSFVSPICVLSDDVVSILGTSSESGYEAGRVIMLSRQESNPNMSKETLILGGFGLSSNIDLLSTINKFNTVDDRYRIEVKDYYQSVDWSQPLEQVHLSQELCRQQMYLDVYRGKGPDIIYDIERNSLAAYEANDLLVDMCSLMEKDTEFNLDAFLPNVIDASMVDGKMCKIPVHFYIFGITGNPSVTKGISSWTIEEFDKIASELPSGMQMIVNMTQFELLKNALAGSMDLFVDEKTKKVSFNTDAFFEILKWAKTYGEKEPVYEEQRVYVDISELLTNELLACNTYDLIWDTSKFASTFPIYYETTPDIIGYPSSSKNGPYIFPVEQVAISSWCDSPEGAWTFVKYLLSEDYQTTYSSDYRAMQDLGMGYGFPIRKESLQKIIELVLNPPKNDGEDAEGDEDNYLDPNAELYGMTQERAEACLSAINSVDTLYYLDSEIFAIIQEESQAYFQDMKSLEEVAALIQNRVQTLVYERE